MTHEDSRPTENPSGEPCALSDVEGPPLARDSGVPYLTDEEVYEMSAPFKACPEHSEAVLTEEELDALTDPPEPPAGKLTVTTGASELPFSLICVECDAGADIPTRERAEREGWTGITDDAYGLSHNQVGLCPDCASRQRVSDGAALEKARAELADMVLLFDTDPTIIGMEDC
jgi:hypothetical protein